MNVLNIRTWADARAFIHIAAPVIAVLLVTQGVLEESAASLWVALVAVLVSPALAMFNTVESFRKWLYPVLGAVAALSIGYGLVEQGALDMWIPVVVLIFGGTGAGIASANTNTTLSTEYTGRHRLAD